MYIRYSIAVALIFVAAGSALAAGEDTVGSPRTMRLPEPQYETAVLQAARFFDGFQWNGDIRVRYDASFDDTGHGNIGTSDRDRGRYSVRLGFTKKMNSRVNAGFRMATGIAASPTSTFQSFDNAMMGTAFSIDLAYLDVVPFEFLPDFRVAGGKIPLPFATTSLAWDRDVSPTGIAETLKLKRGSWDLWGTGGQFFFEDNAAPDDPYMQGGQLGFVHTLNADRGMK